MDKITKHNIEAWLNGPYDTKTKDTIRDLQKNNPKELENAFYTTLAFGTGGLRGIMGVGTNRINIYTIHAATQGLANYLKKHVKGNPKVIISFDSRKNSRLFAEETAKVLAGNKIQAFLMNDLRPTPFLSFALREKKCDAGINITASHNPAAYNGYKVYWTDGAQVLPPHDIGIIQEVNAITSPHQVNLAEPHDKHIHPIGEELDTLYINATLKSKIGPEDKGDLSIIYTPLHGTGITLVPKALAAWGFTNVQIVNSQSNPDGDFPTVKQPNPEYPETLKEGIKMLEDVNGDILLATDPDTDRIGVAVRDQGKIVIFNGNQIATLCMGFICRTKKLPEHAVFVKSIVTTELLRAIAERYGKQCFDTLTGFKYIGELIHKWETEKSKNEFIFGAEESYGYLIGTHSRDKDAVISACLIAEAAESAKKQGWTLVEFLDSIYKEYGVYTDTLRSLDFPETKEGRERMQQGMKRLRADHPRDIGGIAVKKKEDLQPKADVLIFTLSDKSKLTIRPSGTEPKIKIYVSVAGEKGEDIEEEKKRGQDKAKRLLDAAERLLIAG